MHLRDLTYEEALLRHPQEVRSIIEKYRASRSKNRLAEPSTLTWTYRTCVEVDSFSFNDLLEGRYKPKKTPDTREEWVRDQVSRTHTSLCAHIGHMSRGVSEITQKIMDKYFW